MTVSAKIDNDLQEIVARLVKAYSPLRIYLFGSKARGDEDRDSDYDIMVIVSSKAPDYQKDCQLAIDTLWELGLSVDVLVWTEDRFQRRSHLKAALPATILREGKLLYELDPERIAEVREWFEKADEDLEAARVVIDRFPPLTNVAMFHSQQAVEKALKAFLTWHDIPFRKTHNLAEIGRQCIDADISLEKITSEAKPLTRYAWESRYPGQKENPTAEQANLAIKVAEDIYKEIVARLPKEAQP